MSKDELVFVGKIINLEPIPGADFIVSATVFCGMGGKWKGIVRKSEFKEQDLCIVFLPDSLIPECEEMAFMKKSNWRVKMCKFKGMASEVLIMPIPELDKSYFFIGQDVTEIKGVTKYQKCIPLHLQGIAKGDFPGFIPKTDEINYQKFPSLVDTLIGKPWYMTEKADGSSTTAYRWKQNFGICSRNLELLKTPESAYFKVAEKYQVEEKLPEGYAIQWETCGPGIQGNPMALKEVDGFMFSAYRIDEQRYLSFIELKSLSSLLGFPMVRIIEWGHSFILHGVETRGEGLYTNGKQREGVVIRSQENYGPAPISFKVINLNYEK